MTYKNHKLVEVICRITFNAPEEALTLSPALEEKLNTLNFQKKHNITPITISFEYKKDEDGKEIITKEQNSSNETVNEIYQNDTEKLLLAVSNRELSFHVLEYTYKGWEDFKGNFIDPVLNQAFSKLDLTKVPRIAFSYVNLFELSEHELVSDWLNIAVKPEFLGLDSKNTYEFIYNNDILYYLSNIEYIRLFSQLIITENQKYIQFLSESVSGFAENTENESFGQRLSKVHDLAKKGFESTVTQYGKEKLIPE